MNLQKKMANCGQVGLQYGNRIEQEDGNTREEDEQVVGNF